MDFDEEVEVELPHYARKFRMPSDPILLASYELFKPSRQTQALNSERHREIFAEAFIEGELDTLENLCVKALAKQGIQGFSPVLLEKPTLMRVFFDTLDVELPLRECYLIEDQRYWRRVVLDKTLDKTLHLKRWNEFDWKTEGVSRKFVELVETCPVNVVPEQKLAALAQKVWEHVSSIHVRRLQPLADTVFQKYFESDPDQDITSSSSEEEEISSDEPDTDMGEEEGEEEEESRKSEVAIQFWHTADSEPEINDRRNARHQRNAVRQQARSVLERKRAEHMERKERLREKREARKVVEVKKKKKKKKEKPIGDVFSIPVAPEPSDDEDTKPDQRNKLLLLHRIKRYDYPAEHCKHIDLSIIRHLRNLVSLTLEFLGPDNVKDFHSRYLKFSDSDIVRLGKGLRELPYLKTFKLRNGRMDPTKLRILARTLKAMDSLEEVDFGYNQMPDECCDALVYLLQRPRMYRILQLEYNRLGSKTAVMLGKAFIEAQEGVLEYLGLAYNPFNESAIESLVTGLVGTPHVLALNISGLENTKGALGRGIGRLLRNHEPLISLEIAANNIGVSQGDSILKCLEKNQKILYMDCRECDLSQVQEFEVDMIVRRNNYIHENMHHGEKLCDVIKERRHPIVQRIEDDYERLRECQKVRPKFSSSSVESIPEVVEEKDEEERDIWAILGLKNQTAKVEEPESPKDSSSESQVIKEPFVYEPNNFDLEEFRKSVFMPGPGNRFFYLQHNKLP
ncbi:uncharacterized protein [Drosophila kikkawai]|uniref:T-complex-associated testis-expressed protein 1 n=1 Tax=Drosophila kikkawai TaxID=30033 RepID=A0A6P4I282_DROKI|nr:uncharacterized protein LOC108070654 [Drosophila kikkawai]